MQLPDGSGFMVEIFTVYPPVILATEQLCSNNIVKNVSRMCARVNKQTNKLQLITLQAHIC